MERRTCRIYESRHPGLQVSFTKPYDTTARALPSASPPALPSSLASSSPQTRSSSYHFDRSITMPAFLVTTSTPSPRGGLSRTRGCLIAPSFVPSVAGALIVRVEWWLGRSAPFSLHCCCGSTRLRWSIPGFQSGTLGHPQKGSCRQRQEKM